MKLKLTYRRDRSSTPVDLLVTVDPGTSVGELAAHLAGSDPTGPIGPGPFSLALADARDRAIPPDSLIQDSGIASGAEVSLTSARSGAATAAPTAAATVVVISGPDEGREFPIPLGTSYLGRGRDCEVQLSDPMTSRRHAKIHVGETIEISDAGSANGVLIGDSPAGSAILPPGETARLGDTVLTVRFNGKPEDGRGGAGVVRFNRPPRMSPRFAGRTFSLPDVPFLPRGQRFPIIPLFAPLLMGAALYLSTKSTTSLIFMAMSPMMMIGNVAEGQLAGKRNYRQELQKFKAAAEAVSDEVRQEALAEADARRDEYPSLPRCVAAVKVYDPLLWSRRPDRPGFGEVRLGLGAQGSRSTIEFPFSRQSDPGLVRELHDTFDALGIVEGVPVVADLGGEGALGVAGPAGKARDAARAYVMHLAALHSPAEVVVCSICDPLRAAGWEWLKWLPHCDSSLAPVDSELLASGGPGCVTLLGELEALVRRRSEASRSEEAHLPRVLLVLDAPPESERSRLVELAERGPSSGLWIVWVADNRFELPAACRTVVEVPAEARGVSVGYVDGRPPIDLTEVDSLGPDGAEELARRMSPMVDAATRDDMESDVPRSVSFLTIVGRDLADSPERVMERWAENRSILTGPHAAGSRGRPGNLRALIGESATGPHVLDLRVHGPHALVGGTTGAGKSELLQSWIIGMALSNSPQRLTFLLVDYKGGSAFSDCVSLPHTIGLVTDLSPHLVRRALTSLSAELRYREHILHRKRAKDLASLEREGDPEAPPSLVIVVDEFAALVNEVPEFVDGVVNVAQRGRSLGLHLILATQRPSGVIRDNLRANTNLRIALRMADVADSTDVIGTKAAAAFDPATPGRAASRTGPTALVPFQTGYVGGWTSAVPDRPDVVVSTLGFSPRTTWELPADDMGDHPGEGPTDIQRLVTTIGAANRSAEIAAPRKPWLAELAPVYDLAKLPSRRRDDDLVFAVADDPVNQAQPTMSFRPDDDGNMAVFGTGNSGKSTLLRTLCLAAGFTVRGGPCQVYALDFAARGLQMVEQLPHVGSVVPGNDFERVARLLTMIRETIDRRAAYYARVGAGSITQYRQVAGQPEEPRLLLLVDGMGGMRSAYEGTEHHRLFETFLGIAADGRQVGVHVVISADRAGAIPSALGSLIQRRVVLRLAGDNDYAMLGQPTDVLNPKSPPGRGICDGLEIQVAILGGSPDVLAQDTAVRAFAEAMGHAGVTVAPAVRKLEESIPLDELASEVDGRPVFAVASDSLTAVGFEPGGTFTVAGPPGSGRTTALITIAKSFRRWRSDARLVYFGSRRSPLVARLDWERAALDPSEAAKLAPEVAELLGDTADGASPGLVVVENLAEFVQSPADSSLQDMVKSVTANGHLVVSDGEPMPLSGLQALVQAARASRVGVVLQPEQTDATLFRAQFPKVRKSDFPTGRGIYVARGQRPVVVQIAHEGSAAR